MLLFIDIETIPTQRLDLQEHVTSTLKAPSNYKDPEKIAAYIAENRESAIHSTGLDGTFGEIVCIGWALNDEAPSCVGRWPSESEGDLLAKFFYDLAENIDMVDGHGQMRAPTWIGHYITGFDLRFIWQRCVVNNIKPTMKIPYDAKPWDSVVFDTKIEWSGIKSTGNGSLDSISKALGYAGKGDLDGPKVWAAIQEGRLAEVMEYCKDDVNKTRMLHKRMTFAA